MNAKEEPQQQSAIAETPVRQNFSEARESLAPDLRPIFDALCAEVIDLSNYYYGRKLISYSILRHLVERGWKK